MTETLRYLYVPLGILAIYPPWLAAVRLRPGRASRRELAQERERLRESEARLARAQQLGKMGWWRADLGTGAIELSPEIPPSSAARILEGAGYSVLEAGSAREAGEAFEIDGPSVEKPFSSQTLLCAVGDALTGDCEGGHA